MIELSVTVKDSESRYKREFLVYEQCTLSEDDPHIKECIDITLKEFGKMADTIQIRISMEVTDAEFFLQANPPQDAA